VEFGVLIWELNKASVTCLPLNLDKNMNNCSPDPLLHWLVHHGQGVLDGQLPGTRGARTTTLKGFDG
jgi:hypothetical protein